jgi:DNA-binding transcriptional MerR regulator
MGTHQPIRKVVTPEIPDKLYFRIGDVARLCEVPAYVLRFWETEFPQLKPNKGGTGQRLYRKRDVEMALRIKSLLYDQGYTIPGARQVFKNEAKAREAGPAQEAIAPVIAAIPVVTPTPVIATAGEERSAKFAKIDARLRALRAEMQELVAMLSASAGEAELGSAPVTGQTEQARVKPMRPRLVADPGAGRSEPRAPKSEQRMLKPEQMVVMDRRQGDLFPFE